MAPSVVLYLLGVLSDRAGAHLPMSLLKENWGRPRPNSVQQFAGAASFQPWWRPSGTCKRNCSFVSGEASQAFWTVAPASLAPPQIRPIALGGAVVFGTAVGGLRVVFGRHFVTDIVFAGLITIAIVMALYRLLLDPLRRNDARLERGVERVSVGAPPPDRGGSWGRRPGPGRRRLVPALDRPALAQARRLPIVPRNSTVCGA